ncbi:MAG: hypothetical protein ACTSXJ_08140 [Candidatus Baldrarchaeia archaeon]
MPNKDFGLKQLFSKITINVETAAEMKIPGRYLHSKLLFKPEKVHMTPLSLR